MLSIGIIGLPNVGKSTLFNALVKGYQAKVEKYPFTTIKPNIGVVEVPDSKLFTLASVLNLPKKIPATIKFIDIAGLVKGAHKGEGLGNQFLAHIKECQAVLHLLRFFDSSIPHPSGVIDPESDFEIVNTELKIKDLETVKKGKKEKNISQKRKAVLEKIENALNQDKLASETGLTEEEEEEIKDLNLLTLKPQLLVSNINENQIKNPPKFSTSLPICAKLEADLVLLKEKEQGEYLQSLGLSELGLNKIIKEAYKILNLITFYTLLPDQVQAWSIKKGTKADEAAGKIHSDFEKRFIAAEVCPFQELIKFGSWEKAKEKGRVERKGRDYIILDGDVVYFKHR